MQRSALHCLVANITSILWSTLHWASDKRFSLQPRSTPHACVHRYRIAFPFPEFFHLLFWNAHPPFFDSEIFNSQKIEKNDFQESQENAHFFDKSRDFPNFHKSRQICQIWGFEPILAFLGGEAGNPGLAVGDPGQPLGPLIWPLGPQIQGGGPWPGVAPTDPIDHFLTSLSVLIPQLLREVRATLLEVLEIWPFSWAFGTVRGSSWKQAKNREF